MHINIVGARHGMAVEAEDAKSFFYQFQVDTTLTIEEIDHLRDRFQSFREGQKPAAFQFSSIFFSPDGKGFEIHPVAPASLVSELGGEHRGSSIAFFRALCSWLGCEEQGALHVEPDPSLKRLAHDLTIRA